jgi:hypothetical protein
MTSEVMDDYLKEIHITFLSDCDNSKVVIDLEKYVGMKKVNVNGDGVYKNKTLVNGKLTPNPIYLAC